MEHHHPSLASLLGPAHVQGRRRRSGPLPLVRLPRRSPGPVFRSTSCIRKWSRCTLQPGSLLLVPIVCYQSFSILEGYLLTPYFLCRCSFCGLQVSVLPLWLSPRGSSRGVQEVSLLEGASAPSFRAGGALRRGVRTATNLGLPGKEVLLLEGAGAPSPARGGPPARGPATNLGLPRAQCFWIWIITVFGQF